MEPRTRFQGRNSASLCSLAGPYDNPIPPRCLAPIDSLKISALATLSSGIGSLESIPRLHNMKNEDEDDFFWIKTNILVPQLSKGLRITNLFVPKLSKERRQTKVFVPQLAKERRRIEVFVLQLSKERRWSEVFVPQLSKERRRSEVFIPQLSKEWRWSEVFFTELSKICHC